jgi:hypothetical protein
MVQSGTVGTASAPSAHRHPTVGLGSVIFIELGSDLQRFGCGHNSPIGGTPNVVDSTPASYRTRTQTLPGGEEKKQWVLLRLLPDERARERPLVPSSLVLGARTTVVR